MERSPRSDRELREASGHLFYELSMFELLAKVLATDLVGKGVLRNALLESFTIHARVLLDFLFDEKPRHDDVVAADFFVDRDAPAHWRPEMPAALSEVDRRVGKEVAHLTYARLELTDESKRWHFRQIAAELHHLLTQFARSVDPSLLAEEWSQLPADEHDA